MTSEKDKKVWKELKKYGISNEKQLDEAIKSMKLLNIGCFVNKFEGEMKYEIENCG